MVWYTHTHTHTQCTHILDHLSGSHDPPKVQQRKNICCQIILSLWSCSDERRTWRKPHMYAEYSASVQVWLCMHILTVKLLTLEFDNRWCLFTNFDRSCAPVTVYKPFYRTALDLRYWKCIESYSAIWGHIALFMCFLYNVCSDETHTNFTLLHMSGLAVG